MNHGLITKTRIRHKYLGDKVVVINHDKKKLFPVTRGLREERITTAEFNSGLFDKVVTIVAKAENNGEAVYHSILIDDFIVDVGIKFKKSESDLGLCDVSPKVLRIKSLEKVLKYLIEPVHRDVRRTWQAVVEEKAQVLSLVVRSIDINVSWIH